MIHRIPRAVRRPNWDIEVFYAKAGPREIHIHCYARNRGPASAEIHLIPSLWFRNTWSWGDEADRPVIETVEQGPGAAWSIRASHADLGDYRLYGAQPARLLFTENESNAARLWGAPNRSPYVKDAFHRRIIDGESGAVSPMGQGTKLGAWSTYLLSVYDRSKALPPGYSLKQADATGWMAMFALNMTLIALELSAEEPEYEDMAIQCYLQFLAIAEAIAGTGRTGTPSLWDPDAGFFKDLLLAPDGSAHRIDVYSWVGLIPMFATEVVAPRLLALVDHEMLARILGRLLDPEQFLSPHGVRSLSRLHATQRDLGWLPGIGEAVMEYVPGESNSALFGGNSNWRGPVWLPTNYSLIQAIETYHRFLGPGFTVPAPCLGGQRIDLKAVANLLAERLVGLYRRGSDGTIPALRGQSPFQTDPDWRDLCLFYEYFHGETGQGLGASHQTGWTGLLANLVMRRYQRDIQPWSGLDAGEIAAWMHELA